MNWGRNDCGVWLADHEGVGLAVGTMPRRPGAWWWTADHFHAGGDLRVRGAKLSEADAKATAAIVAVLILCLRNLSADRERT